jgi:hypothetical protein
MTPQKRSIGGHLTIAGAAVRAEEARCARLSYCARTARYLRERSAAQLHR